MQLNAPRLRSPCASSKSTRSDEPDEGGNHEVIKGNQEAIKNSSKSTSSDEPAPHASRSKFRPSNGSRHLIREAIMRSSQAIKKQSRSNQEASFVRRTALEQRATKRRHRRRRGRRGGRRREGVRRWCWRRRRWLEEGGEHRHTEGLHEINLRELGRLELGAHLEQLELEFRPLVRLAKGAAISAARLWGKGTRRGEHVHARPHAGASRDLGRSPSRASCAGDGPHRPEWRRPPLWRGRQSPPPR